MIKLYKCLLGITTSGDAIPEGLQLEWWSLLTNYHNLQSIRRFPFLCRSEVISVLRSPTRSSMKNLRRLAKVPSPPMSGSRGRQRPLISNQRDVAQRMERPRVFRNLRKSGRSVRITTRTSLRGVNGSLTEKLVQRPNKTFENADIRGIGMGRDVIVAGVVE